MLPWHGVPLRWSPGRRRENKRLASLLPLVLVLELGHAEWGDGVLEYCVKSESRLASAGSRVLS
jgi:hypothetical protein